MVAALEGAPFTEVEGECAEQMRAIVVAGHISYSTLISEPVTLLRCSKGHGIHQLSFSPISINAFRNKIIPHSSFFLYFFICEKKSPPSFNSIKK